MTAAPMIEISGLSFGYDGDTPALHDVTLSLAAGESACIIGPNGGGKTTLLKLLLGLLEPQSGTIRVFGLPPKEARSRIGYMPQYHQLDAAFPISVMEVVLQGTLTRRSWGFFSREARRIAESALAEMGIAELARRSFAALACRPDLLLLDEPTANIDPGAEEQFYATLQHLRERMSILTVSHDLGFVNRETDRIICVNRRVSLHDAANFDQKTADEIYHHRVSMVHHDHACFCGCGGEEHHD